MPKHLRRAEIFKGAWPHATCAMQCHGTALVHERRRLMIAGFRTGAPRVERLTLRLLQALLAAEGLMIQTRIRKGVRIYRGARPAA
jgi:hypothetical protein